MGTSKEVKVKNDTEQDHPHAYGDKLVLILYGLQLKGSSPRVWGQVYHHT